MARNEEKANAMLNRWTSMKTDMSKVVHGRRPFDTKECTSLADAERYRRQVIRIISRKVSEIQNASLGEHVIRDLNDLINKRIGEKHMWEKRIVELGGSRYASGKFEDGYEADGVTLQSGKGYKYFGAAKNLPGVRELFEKKEPPKQKRSRKDMYLGIEPDYYGQLDVADDADLVAEEAMMEARRIQEAIAEWERREAEKLEAQQQPAPLL
ncbi:hypothetical protein SDRG_10503 [Saprolegnia diclina VS20]|uniref:Pre-mRNA-splicing factor ISY1 n=1 Tax=Saprolegnia diclina (strain VS20) TaxID=1156394 RepID=T0QDP6_SAPDV|nr:hypothetical protein SDRG_10503 [Saprolegnia diclina VS20]EQC31710.1 hypothetical protein SDRG_10503 [Saprolegnia diclina VS20]|eukprot:XP_008614717.1 hypothetical protein SDRG_10503 [Saprolegnia diclina VS20]